MRAIPSSLLFALLVNFASAQQNEVSGDCVIRGGSQDSEITITTTDRVAGAIDSLVWKGKEFIDSYDHGRQLQSASNFDCSTKFEPETFNPTEAGSLTDGVGPHSTSRLLHLTSGDDWLQTTTQMAFWLEPDQLSFGNPAKNTTALSNHLLTKRLQIGVPDFPHVIRYDVTFGIPLGEKHTLAQFEIVTGYMPFEFRSFHCLDPQSGLLAPLSDGPGEQDKPVILATEDSSYAMGVIAVNPAEPVGYGRFAFEQEKVTKWNVVARFRDEEGVPAGDYSFRTLIAVGDLETVRSTLTQLLQRETTRPKIAE